MSVLSRFLPPPTYITMPCVGVDISDTSLKYVLFKPHARSTTKKELEIWGDIPIPNGTLNRGEIIDVNQLVLVLKEFKKITKADFIRVSLPEERAYLFETEIRENTPSKEVRGLLEFRLEENVPIPSKDVLFDYMFLENAESRSTAQIAVAAYARETINTYHSACIEAGLRPVSFEVEAQAMARAVVPDDISGAVMLVDFGKTRTGIGIVYNKALLYTSTIDIGGNELSTAMRKVLGPEVAESELTRLKNTEGLVKRIGSSDVHDALISTISVIKDELSTRMQYWHLRNGHSQARKISSIILCGGSSNLKGLPEYMTESLGVPSVRGDVWENTFSLEDTVPPIDKKHSFGYATAIGLALRNTV